MSNYEMGHHSNQFRLEMGQRKATVRLNRLTEDEINKAGAFL